MEKRNEFIDEMTSGYSAKGKSIVLGSALLDGEVIKEARVQIPLKTLNRHGLIAGATGTGKTVTLQIIAESICNEGVPVLLMDVKGDLSGIAAKGQLNDKITERCTALGIDFEPNQTEVEFLSLSKEPGVRLRATVTEFGPVLFSKILELNETQSGVIAMLFKYADDKNLPLLDLKDVKQLLQYATGEGKPEIQKQYGNLSTATTSIILRKIIELETQGAEQFFGEKSFDVNDLLRINSAGKGIASVIRLTDIQDKPKLFSTFMLCLLAELYATLPEAGDLDKPKLCLFIDEAHLIFKESSSALQDQIETIIKLIRSKGVGVFFITQNPYDVPDAVLSQLGLKVQHALRAFTEKDRKAIRKTAENYPISNYYKTDQVLTSLGIGQALVTALNEKGIPTPLAAVHLKPPSGRIGTLNQEEIAGIVNSSKLVKEYNQDIDRESAYELLTGKMTEPKEEEPEKEEKTSKPEKSLLEKASENPMVRQVGRTVVRELTRGLLGVLGLNSTGKRKKGWF